MMKMKKASLKIFLLYLGFSFLLSSAAVPTTRSLKAFQEDTSLQDLLAQGTMETNEDEVFEGIVMKGRMDIESNDYPGTGANNHHDPKPPGRH